MALRIKNFIKELSLRQIVFSLIVIVSLFLFFLLTLWADRKTGQLIDQQAAARWDEEGNSAQVSCFFAENVEVDESTLMSFEKQLNQTLMEVLPAEDTPQEPSGSVSGSVSQDAPESSGRRLFIDSYSSLGSITVTSEGGKLEDVQAVGIGGDFFLFHPLQLVSGGYFSGNDLMKDFVLLDEDAAWQLFGSSDIAGQSVMIADIPHYISGVIKRQEGRFAESAGLDKTVVYVSNETLASYGKSSGICVYEVVAPDPVKHFVYNCVKEKIGVKENEMIVVENSSRYLPESIIPVILDYGTRSMQNAAVRFPYWENIGRAWEDVRALAMIFQVILLLIPILITAVFLVRLWKRKKYTLKDVGNFLLKIRDKVLYKAHDEKDKWRHF